MAYGPRQGAARRSAAGLLESVSPTGKEDDPDRRGPPVGGREGRGRERRVVPGKRKWAGGGVLGLGEKGKKKEREKGRWAGWAEIKGRKKKRLCIFETNSNNSIQTQIQEIQI